MMTEILEINQKEVVVAK